MVVVVPHVMKIVWHEYIENTKHYWCLMAFDLEGGINSKIPYYKTFSKENFNVWFFKGMKGFGNLKQLHDISYIPQWSTLCNKLKGKK